VQPAIQHATTSKTIPGTRFTRPIQASATGMSAYGKPWERRRQPRVALATLS
jgi:hypothetical protein